MTAWTLFKSSSCTSNDPRIRLTVCTNGLEAVQAFKQAPFDLVLMDIQMPVLDGCAATLSIRHWEVQHKLPPTPITALTASSTASDLAKIFKAGCTNYLPKPITKPILLQTVNQFFGLRPKAPAAEVALALHS